LRLNVDRDAEVLQAGACPICHALRNVRGQIGRDGPAADSLQCPAFERVYGARPNGPAVVAWRVACNGTDDLTAADRIPAPALELGIDTKPIARKAERYAFAKSSNGGDHSTCVPPAHEDLRRGFSQRQRHKQRLQHKGRRAGTAAFGCLRHVEHIGARLRPMAWSKAELARLKPISR
jgi:hypothetical protein